MHINWPKLIDYCTLDIIKVLVLKDAAFISYNYTNEYRYLDFKTLFIVKYTYSRTD